MSEEQKSPQSEAREIGTRSFLSTREFQTKVLATFPQFSISRVTPEGIYVKTAEIPEVKTEHLFFQAEDDGASFSIFHFDPSLLNPSLDNAPEIDLEKRPKQMKILAPSISAPYNQNWKPQELDFSLNKTSVLLQTLHPEQNLDWLLNQAVGWDFEHERPITFRDQISADSDMATVAERLSVIKDPTNSEAYYPIIFRYRHKPEQVKAAVIYRIQQRQIPKTINGVAYTPEQLTQMIKDIPEGVDLGDFTGGYLAAKKAILAEIMDIEAHQALLKKTNAEWKFGYRLKAKQTKKKKGVSVSYVIGY